MARRILVLEDEEAISGMIAMNLKAAGMEPVVFANGLKVRDALPGDHAYDLALLDVMVPGLDGFGVFELLKPYKIPAIFLTARDDLDSKLLGLTGGAEDYHRGVARFGRGELTSQVPKECWLLSNLGK